MRMCWEFQPEGRPSFKTLVLVMTSGIGWQPPDEMETDEDIDDEETEL